MGNLLEYKNADPIFKKTRIKEFISRDLIPTNRMNFILIGIFCFVLIIGIIQFPLGQFLSGQIEGLKISAGYPLYFMEIDVIKPLKSPFNLIYLTVDLLIYILLAYLIDILITAVLKIFPSKLERENKEISSLYHKEFDRRVIQIN